MVLSLNKPVIGSPDWGVPVNQNWTAIEDAINALAPSLVPVGSMLPYGGATAPTGWLLCNGGAISRTTYADLFAIIGTAYGAGDGSTTFNLPNYTGRVPQGMGRGYANAGLPNISGTFSANNTVTGNLSGAFYQANTFGSAYTAQYGLTAVVVGLNAARSSGVYGASTTVQPPATISNFIIKY